MPGPPDDGDHFEPAEIAHGALRGTIAAMAMTGMRAMTVNLGLVDETPPSAILRQRAKGVYKLVPRKQRRTAREAFHWSYGAGGGAAFAALPEGVRLRPWAGPVYGFVVWLGFELVLAPALGLSQAKKPRLVERICFAVDHLLYGLVLSETRRQPQG